MTHLKVAVRIRPLSEREIHADSSSVIEVHDGKLVAVTNLKVPEQNAGDSRERIKRFTFDYCFQPSSTQEEIFDVVGEDVKKAIQKRFHSCILAYGQSSSGKTHTMMGNLEDPGLAPKLCQNIFNYLKDYQNDESYKDKDGSGYKVKVSYLEIYNEKVRDLLVSVDGGATNLKLNLLRVREHPKKGPYVQGLTHRLVNDAKSLLYWLETGNGNRRVSSTLTNRHSSRSHSVFTITCGEGVELHLIDLAGSERTGHRFHNISTFKEGANINKSLVALGNVISTLAEHSSKYLKDQRKRFVPYRDSVLTWLLKDTLGGNAKTIMIATVSPSNTCYNETINTLRFGQRAKKIISHPVVNEDPKERTIRELRTEIVRLKQLLALHQESKLPSEDNKSLDDNNQQDTLCKLSVSAFVTNVNNKRNIRVQEKTEKLWPVINVISEIDNISKRKVLRILGLDNNKMETKPKRLYGSHELISNSSTNKQKVTKRLSQPSIMPRKQFTDHSKKTALTKKINETSTKKVEAGVLTEVRGPRVSSLRKPSNSVKPRSAIVAEVTNRLYGKTKKKEAGTETEEPKPAIEETPKELTICSNARFRLREITQQALWAHRRRNVDTQTDLFPVLRVKEMSTDSSDLKVTLAEVKNVYVDAVKIQTKEAGITCCFVENFDSRSRDFRNAFIITRSCGTQSTENLAEEPLKMRDHLPTSGISFTKYLQNNTTKEPTFQIINPCTSNPIYTSSVNINVSHNYISPNQDRQQDTISNDSLEEASQPSNFPFPTPDIISNHNSLEPGNANENRQENYATSCSLLETIYTLAEEFIIPDTLNLCVASFSLETSIKERINKVNIPLIYAVEICVAKKAEERCEFLWNTLHPTECVNSQLVKEQDYKHYAVITVPKVATPVVARQIEKTQRLQKSTSKENKGFCSSKTKEENDKIIQAMSIFMNEATNLISNLTKAANKLQKEHSFDLEVTVSDIHTLIDDCNTHSVKESQTQTCAIENNIKKSERQTIDAGSNTDHLYQVHLNNYDDLVRHSCDRLERCIDKIEEQSFGKYPHQKTKSFLVNSPASNIDSSSLESTITFSEYGSLPRPRQKRCPTCSPSAYLKQLTTMRKHIVESSRDDLIGEDNRHYQ